MPNRKKMGRGPKASNFLFFKFAKASTGEEGRPSIPAGGQIAPASTPALGFLRAVPPSPHLVRPAPHRLGSLSSWRAAGAQACQNQWPPTPRRLSHPSIQPSRHEAFLWVCVDGGYPLFCFGGTWCSSTPERRLPAIPALYFAGRPGFGAEVVARARRPEKVDDRVKVDPTIGLGTQESEEGVSFPIPSASLHTSTQQQSASP